MAVWEAYQEAVRAIVARQWDERQAIIAWLEYVRATHRDAYTMTTLETALRLGKWGARMVELGRQSREWPR